LVVYKIINIVNKKIYIGSALDFTIRKNRHLNALRKNKHHNQHLQNAFNLYGESSFIFEIIEEVENYKELLQKEQFYIDKFKSFDIDVGYNINRSTSSCILFGENNGMYGRKGKDNINSISIIQTDLNGCIIKKFNGFRDAERETGIDHSLISKACKGKRILVNNYLWFYENDYFEENIIRRINKLHKKANKEPKKVVQLSINNEFINLFESIYQAWKSTGVAVQSICSCCKYKNKSAGGYIWKYYEDYCENTNSGGIFNV
jgi:group I intron endonuclease